MWINVYREIVRKIDTDHRLLSLENMNLPAAVYTQCPICKEETLHRVIKGKLGEKKPKVLEALVKCSQCDHIHQDVIRAERKTVIPLILSEQESSLKTEMELPENEIIQIDSEYHLDRNLIKITAIEVGNKRVLEAKATDISTLWAKKFDRIKLKISINKGSRTLKRTIWAVPDEEFFIGDVMRIKGLNLAIHAIKTKDKRIKKGSVAARDIVRLYAKAVR
jgi:uncharacterized Zn finger protein